MGHYDSTMKVLSRWTLTINTITLSSTGWLWPALPGFTDDDQLCQSELPKWLYELGWLTVSKAMCMGVSSQLAEPWQH